LQALNKNLALEDQVIRIVNQKEDVIEIKNPPNAWTFGSILSLPNNSAILLSLQKTSAKGLLLKRQGVQSNSPLTQLMEFPVKMGWGVNQSCLGEKFG